MTMKGKRSEQDNINYDVHDTIYDFSVEHNVLMVLGLAKITKKPKSHLVLNILWYLTVYALNIFILVLMIETMSLVYEDRKSMMKVLQALGNLIGILIVPLLKLSVNDGLEEAARLIRDGVFAYEEGLDGEQHQLKVDKISSLRQTHVVLAVMIYAQAFSNVIYELFKRCIQIDNDSSDNLFDPNLPLPLVMPFDTKPNVGYAIAFTCTSAYLIIFSTICLGIYFNFMGSVQQLVCQIEILNYSLLNMEKRAILKMSLKGYNIEKMESQLPQVYMSLDFQSCFLSCLRDNIEHHQKIIRLKDKISPFIERIQGVIILLFSAVCGATILTYLEGNTNNGVILLTAGINLAFYFALSYMGQIITDRSAETLFALYSTPWYYCGKEFISLQKIFMPNLLQPIVFSTRGIRFPISFKTYADMVSLAYRVINVLR